MGKPYVLPVMPADDPKTRAPKGEAEILRLFRGAAIGSDIAGVRGTAWGTYNALTEYLAHQGRGTEATRTEALTFGGNVLADTSDRALETLLRMVA